MIIIDFETYSEEDIDNGAVKYSRHPSTDIICMGYKVDEQPTRLWLPGQEPPKEFSDPDQVFWAHNAAFDYCIYNVVGVTKYDFPILALEKTRDSMALANRYTLPHTLEECGEVLGLQVQKQKIGKSLIKKICVPNKYGERPRVQIDFSYDELDQFYAYCRDDVTSTYELIQTLPSQELTPQEQEYWRIVQLMNFRGLPVHKEICEKILSYIEGYAKDMQYRLVEISNGEVTKATQAARIVKWANSRGVKLPNLQAETVEQFLDEEELPDDVKEMLELRQAIGRSSTAKYRKMIDMEIDGRVHGSMQYYGAQKTGRIAGRGIQLHNLPRASVKDPEKYISMFDNYEPVEDPIQVAKALIRSMICAEFGIQLIVSDYSSIENCILMWYADEKEALESIFRRDDQYKRMAMDIYNKSYEDILNDSFERLVGKIAVLGCGFGMGPDRFQDDSRTKWKVKFELHEADFIIKTWRKKHALTVKMWYKWKDCVVAAIRNPGKVYTSNKCTFRVAKDKAGHNWLVIKLPTGRQLFYMEPFLDYDKYGQVPKHWGINPYSKKWSRLALIPGRITENIVQATARDIMMQGLYNVEHYMPEVDLLGSIHDEALGEINEEEITEDTLPRFNELLCRMPAWADGLPLFAKGWIGKRYKK